MQDIKTPLKPSIPQVPQFDDLVKLEDICKPIMGITFQVARRYHALGKLSVKAFRLGDTSRGPLFVHKDDLEALIDKRRKGR